MKKIIWLSMPLILIVTACTTSRITSSWKAENTVSKKYNKIMVLGLIRDTDRSLRENMENHFVGDLNALGYDAVSSLKEFGPKAFDKMNEEDAVRKLKDSGIDGVITIVLLDKAKERKYYPGNLYYYPYGYYYNRFWGYRIALSHRIYESGYYAFDTKYFWESNLYDMETQKLVYSVQTQSFDPATSESMGHEYGQMIVKDMVKKNVLKSDLKITPKAF